MYTVYSDPYQYYDPRFLFRVQGLRAWWLLGIQDFGFLGESARFGGFKVRGFAPGKRKGLELRWEKEALIFRFRVQELIFKFVGTVYGTNPNTALSSRGAQKSRHQP